MIPESGLGIEPELLTRLHDDERFRKVWDALPGDDEIDAAAALTGAAPERTSFAR